MTVKELQSILDKLILDGKGDLDAVCFACEYMEGDCGHEPVVDVEVRQSTPLYKDNKMTTEVVVISHV